MERDLGSVSDAAASIASLIPDVGTRELLLDALATLVSKVHELNASSWSLTLSSSPSYLNLNVGPRFLLTLWPDHVSFAVPRTFQASNPRLFAQCTAPGEGHDLKSPTLTWFSLPHNEFLQQWPILEPGLEQSLRLSARRAAKSRYASSHSAQAVDAVATAVGRVLPQPNYTDEPAPATRVLWVIRAGEHGEAHSQFVAGQQVGIGWEALGDVAGLKTQEEIRSRYESAYPADGDPSAGVRSLEIHQFANEIEPGDAVLYPVKNQSTAIVGRVTSGCRHEPEQVLTHVRDVLWFREIGSEVIPGVRQSMPALRRSCSKVTDAANEFWDFFASSAILAAAARDLVALLNGQGDASDRVRSHRRDHDERQEQWSRLLDGPEDQPSGSLLRALKKTDWYRGAKRTNVPTSIENSGGEGEILRKLRAAIEKPPTIPSEIDELVKSLPGFGLAMVSEVLSYARPDIFWEYNGQVVAAVARLPFDGWRNLPRGERNDPGRYFALGPLQEGIRSSLRLAGLDDGTFLDVDLLLWELNDKPSLFPSVPPRIDENALMGLIADLKSFHPSFATFADRPSSWWDDEASYKEELRWNFTRLFGSAVVEGVAPTKLVGRLRSLLTEPLPSTNRPQNLISWRQVAMVKKLESEDHLAAVFGEALGGLLHDDGSSEERLQRFTDATWPLISKSIERAGPSYSRSIPTLLLMLQNPDEDILVRTDEFSRASDVLTGESILGDGPITASDYIRVKAFASALRSALDEHGMEPTSLVDIQGFIHVVSSRNTWLLQANPTVFDLEAFLAAGNLRTTWHVPRYADRVREGDEVYLWVAGEDRGLVAQGTLASDTITLSEAPVDMLEAERPYFRDEGAKPATESLVLVDIDRSFPEPDRRIPAQRLKEHPVLSKLLILRQAAGTVFPVNKEQALALRRLVPRTDEEDNVDLFTHIEHTLREAGLFFSRETLANYLAALKTKGFVILTGISGTGKSQLAIQVAQCLAAFEPRPDSLSEPSHEATERTDAPGSTTESVSPSSVVVAVRPDWTDQRGLLGYHNLLTGQYSRTPFVDLLETAVHEWDRSQLERRTARSFFAILDEMNLARVEHYFSDFLSCMESGNEIRLHDDPSLEATTDCPPTPRTIPLPPNLFVVGTVNVDETTFMFSPKVLDRAFTIELNDVDLEEFARDADTREPADVPSRLPSFEGLAAKRRKPHRKDWQAFGAMDGGAFRDTVIRLNNLLQPHGRHFGYRVANEIARFVTLYVEQDSPSTDTGTGWAALDLAVLQKVLPKFHGTQQDLQAPLEDLFRFSVDPHAADDSSIPGWERWSNQDGELRPLGQEAAAETRLPRTAAKVYRMLRRLRDRGFVSYIE